MQTVLGAPLCAAASFLWAQVSAHARSQHMHPAGTWTPALPSHAPSSQGFPPARARQPLKPCLPPHHHRPQPAWYQVLQALLVPHKRLLGLLRPGPVPRLQEEQGRETRKGGDDGGIIWSVLANQPPASHARAARCSSITTPQKSSGPPQPSWWHLPDPTLQQQGSGFMGTPCRCRMVMANPAQSMQRPLTLYIHNRKLPDGHAAANGSELKGSLIT